MPRDHDYPSGHITKKEKQFKVLVALESAGPDGLTSRELAQIEQPGDVSAQSAWGSAFTVLHQENAITALAERRGGHHIYVGNEYVGGRDTWPGYRHKGTVIITHTVVIHCSACGGHDGQS